MNKDLEIFLKEFLKRAKNNDELKNHWNSKDFTDIIMNLIESLSQNLSLVSIKEYWKIDCIYYHPNKVHLENRVGIWLNELDFAIEHENVISKAFEEVNKLFLWKAKNKVLITYYSEKYPKEKHLEEWEKMINKMDNKDENFLIIFGNDDTKEYDSFHYWLNDNNVIDKKFIKYS